MEVNCAILAMCNVWVHFTLYIDLTIYESNECQNKHSEQDTVIQINNQKAEMFFDTK